LPSLGLKHRIAQIRTSHLFTFRKEQVHFGDSDSRGLELARWLLVCYKDPILESFERRLELTHSGRASSRNRRSCLAQSGNCPSHETKSKTNNHVLLLRTGNSYPRPNCSIWAPMSSRQTVLLIGKGKSFRTRHEIGALHLNRHQVVAPKPSMACPSLRFHTASHRDSATSVRVHQYSESEVFRG
jgi:hypothetical protein